jgi:hypothetical protein
MPELVTCPSCGCRVQMAEALLGRRVRCIACQAHFTAEAGAPQPPRPTFPPPLPPAAAKRQDEDDDEDPRPFCPGCGRRVLWEVTRCPHCGEELEAETDLRRRLRLGQWVRRDSLPHRGRLIAALGTFSMVTGGLSLCLFGLGSLVALPAGVAAWVMASRDLELMRSGEMDHGGRAQTENGRVAAIVGITLATLFAAFFALMVFRPLF